MPSRLSTGKYLHAEAVSFYLPSPVAETQYLALSYNTDGVLAVIRAAERKRSLAIIQRFPWTMQFQGPHFVRYVVEERTVQASQLLSILITASKKRMSEWPSKCPLIPSWSTRPLDDKSNVDFCREIVQLASKRNITIEAEMGRIEDGEDGLPSVDMESILTAPDSPRKFVQSTGVHVLAPSFGNIHGGYPEGGAEKAWDLDRLSGIGAALTESSCL
ncbi:ketose-bisphosphate aldolase [Thermoascus aurantiacus ATCC 26904]